MRVDLQKYNRVVWAILGTLGLLALLALLIGGAAELWPSKHAGPSLAAAEPSQGTGPGTGQVTGTPISPTPLPLRLGLPSDLPGTGLLLVPVEGPEPDQRGGGGFGSYSKGGPAAPLFNLVFVDPRTGSAQQLLDRKALITHHEVLTDQRGNLNQAVGLALRMVLADTNGNGRLDEGDEEKVFLCEPTGKGLREILPAGAACVQWEFDAPRRTLFVLIHPKGKGDAATEVLSVPLDASQPARPLLDNERIKALRLLLQR